MELGELSRLGKRCCLVLVVVAALLLVVIDGAAIGVSLQQQPEQEQFKDTFFSRCESSKEYNCPKIWEAFQQAYVNRDHCKVPVEAYDPLIAAAPFQPACNRMMFWSGTKGVVQDFTEKKDCFVTLEDTLLGKVLDGLTWCGKEGSNETFTSGCPKWSDCDNNPVRSFWRRVSATYADAACGHITAMLDASRPYSNRSIFKTVELKRFNPTKAKSLTVVLVSMENDAKNCSNPSLNELQNDLQKGIKYRCKEASQSQIEACSADPAAACGSCW